MTQRIWATGLAGLLLAGCIETQIADIAEQSEFIAELPEQVIAAVAPSQDLRAVKIDPVDGCYVYQYVGPVETTFLPLLTREGRSICTAAQQELVVAPEA